MKKGRIAVLISVLTVITLVITLAVFAKNVSFKDVSSDDYFYEPVEWALDSGITEGTSPDTFSPNAFCTRGHVVTFLWRLAGQPDPESTGCAFKDVKEDDYFFKPVLWANEENITLGVEDDRFGPELICTREQIVTFIWRYSGCPENSLQITPFTDVDTESYSYDAILWAISKGITDGTSATTFSPTESCTRGQIVTFLFRLAGEGWGATETGKTTGDQGTITLPFDTFH